MDANNYKAFTGKGRRRRHTQMSEINVTPFVDVMLVLLIVFMVTAPLLTVGVPLELPNTKAATVQGNDEPLVISVDGEGRLFLEDVEVMLENLVPKLQAVTFSCAAIPMSITGAFLRSWVKSMMPGSSALPWFPPVPAQRDPARHKTVTSKGSSDR